MVEGLLFLVLITYACMMVWLARGWSNRKRWELTGKDTPLQGITVIVPARNEEKNIGNCLASLAAQDFSFEYYEVVVVDDHSEDATARLVLEAQQQYGLTIRLLTLDAEVVGKKGGIAKGVGAARFDRIITVDADCTVGKDWLKTYVDFWDITNAKMIIGPVKNRPLTTFFDRIQACDFTSMVSFGAATCLRGKPTICNGANLGFSVKAFNAVNGYGGNEQLASGDDVFLLHKMKKYFPEGIFFLDQPAAVVSTSPCADWSTFIEQRLRWAEKGKHYRDQFTIVVSTLLLLAQVALLWSGLLLLSEKGNYSVQLGLAIALKLSVDYYFIFPFLSFFDMRKEAFYFLPVQLLYPFYLLLIVIFAPFYQFSWKGRTPQLKLEKASS
jgi:cellulose synthase/poly-beta-1,6-N-acetylglucosamine synthase-like glycosyltransferase